MTDHRRSIGALAEEIVAERLKQAGWEILERNYRTRYGELDIIGRADRLVVFVEVKSALTGSKLGPTKPSHAVDRRKRAQIRRIATQWLTGVSLPRPCAGFRFDVIGLTFEPSGELVEYEHLPGAF